jgi:hypothetical protein
MTRFPRHQLSVELELFFEIVKKCLSGPAALLRRAESHSMRQGFTTLCSSTPGEARSGGSRKESMETLLFLKVSVPR